jgi:hypothetical protein
MKDQLRLRLLASTILLAASAVFLRYTRSGTGCGIAHKPFLASHRPFLAALVLLYLLEHTSNTTSAARP